MERFFDLRISLMKFYKIKGADEDTYGFAKTFPDIPCASQMLGVPILRLGVAKECLNVLSSIGLNVNDTRRLVTWEFPLQPDSAS